MAVYQRTFLQIRTAVIAKLKLDTGDSTDSDRVNEAVNLAYQQAVQETACLQQTSTAALTDGAGTYDLPTQVAWIRSLWITYPDGSFSDPLQQVDLEEIEEHRRDTSADATVVVKPLYAIAGQNQLEVWPTPGAGQTMTFVYVYLPDQLVNDGDVPAIMEPYGSKLLEYGALVELARLKKDPLLADYENGYQAWMLRFQAWLNRRQGSSGRVFRVQDRHRHLRLADRSADTGGW